MAWNEDGERVLGHGDATTKVRGLGSDHLVELFN